MLLRKKPILCNYYLTYRCNATCSFCDIWEKPSPYVQLENVEKNLKDLKKLGVKIIDFTGGEPLLHRQLPDFLVLAKSLKFITTVTTNALLYPKFAQKLKGKVDMLHFSLDSADEQTHNQMRGVKCFDKLIESIKIAKELGERPDILFTVFNKNLHEIENIQKNIAIPNQLMLILNPVFSYQDIGEGLSKDSLRQLYFWAKQKNIYLNEAFLLLRQNGGNQIERPVCRAGTSTVVISPENRLIVPCYHLGIESFEIKDNLYELYYSEKVQKIIRMEGRLPACQSCVINCYMQPSFAVEMSKYWWKALPSTLKYNFFKGTWKNLI